MRFGASCWSLNMLFCSLYIRGNPCMCLCVGFLALENSSSLIHAVSETLSMLGQCEDGLQTLINHNGSARLPQSHSSGDRVYCPGTTKAQMLRSRGTIFMALKSFLYLHYTVACGSTQPLKKILYYKLHLHIFCSITLQFQKTNCFLQ